MCICLLSGCAAVKNEDNEKLIAVSFYPVYVFTLNITEGIEDLNVKCMAEQNTGCLHDYTLTAEDARLISDCSAFVINGAGMEEFLEDVEELSENAVLVDSSTGIELICPHEEEEHHEHNHANNENSHIWMSVTNAIRQVENICEGLSRAFPEYEEEFKENASAYIQRLEILQQDMVQVGASLEGCRVITFHDAYAYFAQELGIEIFETIESHDGGEPSAKRLAQLTDEIKLNDINVLITEPDYSGSAAAVLAQETDAQIYVLNPVLKGDKIKTAYEDIMRNNLEILKAVK